MTITSSSTTTMAENRVAGWLTPQEFSILEAVCEALLPSLEPPEGSSGTLAAYYRRSAYDLNVAELLAEALAVESAETLTEFRQLLALLASTAASLMLVGSIRPFLELRCGDCGLLPRHRPEWAVCEIWPKQVSPRKCFR